MDFELTSEQRTFQDSVLRFARERLADGALERAHQIEYPWDVARDMAEVCLLYTSDAADE